MKVKREEDNTALTLISVKPWRCRQRPSIDLLYDIADVLGVQAVKLLPRNKDV